MPVLSIFATDCVHFVWREIGLSAGREAFSELGSFSRTPVAGDLKRIANLKGVAA